MKRIILLASLLISASLSSIAQEFNGKGDVMFNIGIGLADNNNIGDHYFGNGKYNNFPTLVTSLDFGIHKYITVGPYINFHTRSFKHSDWNSYDGRNAARNWKIRENWFQVGGRGLFMVTPFLNEVANTNLPENLHLYAGLLIGMDFYHKKAKNDDYDYTEGTTDVHAALLAAGARYMFAPGVGAYVELYPIGNMSVINTGLTFKF